MLKARQRNLPPLPSTANMDDLIAALQEVGSEYGKNFKSAVRTAEGQYSLIFVSEEAEGKLNSGQVSYMSFDGTFETCPSDFYQSFGIMGEYLGELFPMITVLMTSKSTAAYDSVFSKINELFPLFQPSQGMGDFELASRNSIKTHFPGIDLRACQFHEAQCVYRRVQKKGHTVFYREDQMFRRWTRSLMALPFLPANRIGPTLEVLRQQYTGFPVEQQPAIQDLASYWKKTFFDEYSPEELSVYRLKRATNNEHESYHSKLKAHFKAKPSLRRYLIELNKMSENVADDFRRVERGERLGRKQKLKYKRNRERRLRLWQKLDDGMPNLEFLAAIQYTMHEAIELDQPDRDSDSESSEEEQDPLGGDDVNPPPPPPTGPIGGERICCICLSPLSNDRIIVLKPCKHARACATCLNRWQQTNNTCPLCRCVVTDRDEIFL